MVDKSGKQVGKYRKIHLPGHAENESWRPFQHLEKRYFEIGNLGWGVWRTMNSLMGMCICNDRRWPETYRVMGLQGVEMVLLGYNTPRHHPPTPEHDRLGEFHNQLSMQAGAYANATWVIGVANGGIEEGCELSAAPRSSRRPASRCAGADARRQLVVAAAIWLGRSYKETHSTSSSIASRRHTA